MSLKELLSHNKSIGIEVILKENESQFNVVMLQKKGGRLIIEKKQEGLKNIEELKSSIDNKSPVIISISGKGIIHKKILQTDQEYNINTLLNKALPGASINDFNVQVTKSGAESFYVSLIRTSILNDVIEQFIENKITNLSSWFLGPFVMNTISEHVALKNNITISNQSLTIENNSIVDIRPLSEAEADSAIEIGDEKIPSSLLIAFAAAFSYFVPQQKGIENSELLNEIKDEYKAKRRFELTGMLSISGLFLLLLINYFVFSSYWEKSSSLNYVYNLNEASLHEYDTLKKEFQFKKQFMLDNGLSELSKSSYYLDNLAKDLPPSISWTTVKINPMKNIKNNVKDVFLFDQKTMDITGKCEQSADLNQWMKQIKQKEWIDKITLLNYSQSQKKEWGIFLIKVIIK